MIIFFSFYFHFYILIVYCRLTESDGVSWTDLFSGRRGPSCRRRRVAGVAVSDRPVRSPRARMVRGGRARCRSGPCSRRAADQRPACRPPTDHRHRLNPAILFDTWVILESACVGFFPGFFCEFVFRYEVSLNKSSFNHSLKTKQWWIK